MDLHPTPLRRAGGGGAAAPGARAPGPGTRALGYRGGWDASPHFLGLGGVGGDNTNPDSVSDIFWGIGGGGEPDNYPYSGDRGVGNLVIIQIIPDKQAIGVVRVKAGDAKNAPRQFPTIPDNLANKCSIPASLATGDGRSSARATQ